MTLASAEPGTAARSSAGVCLLERANMLLDQAQPLVLAGDLFLEPSRQRPSVSRAHRCKRFDEATLHRHRIADAMCMQQPLDTIAVCRAVLEQALPLARQPFAVFVFHRRHMQHAAVPRFAPYIGEERPHQFVQIDPIGLGAAPDGSPRYSTDRPRNRSPPDPPTNGAANGRRSPPRSTTECEPACHNSPPWRELATIGRSTPLYRHRQSCNAHLLVAT